MKKILFVMLFGLFLLGVPKAGYSQQDSTTPKITMELNDSPVRTSLEMLFKQANIQNYVIDNSVAGFISMKITDQPFETALKLIMRGATDPLTYTKENGVYIVKLRIITPVTSNSVPDITVDPPASNVIWERIPLTFIDPFDLQIVFGPILNISQFSRSAGGGMMGGMGNGGFGGGFGNAGGLGGGSMGGFGGAGMGMGNGMGGGAMGGFGGMMGSQGGMGGGMGGFGGGRNF
jgi:hypothetical protein